MDTYYVVMVDYVDGSDFIGLFWDYMKAEQMIDDLIKYKKDFGAEQIFKIYEIDESNFNKFLDYKELEKYLILEVE